MQRRTKSSRSLSAHVHLSDQGLPVVARHVSFVRRWTSVAHKGSHGECGSTRFGFTLLELLIVLMILVTVVSLSLPALRSSLDKSRLVSAAKEMQVALAKAKSLAVRESAAVQFRYEHGGQRWVIEKRQLPIATDSVVVLDSPNAATTNEAAPVAGSTSLGTTSGDSAEDLNAAAVLREGVLPSGVTFADVTMEDATQTTMPGTGSFAEQVASRGTTTEAVPVIGLKTWSEPIVFQPSGRTRGRTFRLHGQRQFEVTVTLRGLTSTATFSPPVRREVTDSLVATSSGDVE